MKDEKEYALFAEAMDQFSKLAKLALKALKPFKDHTGNCATACPSCRLRSYYGKVEAMTTEISK